MNENSGEEIAPPSPYANNNDMKDDVIISALEKDSDDFVQVSDEEKEDNEEKDEEEEEVEGPETPAESISVEVIIADEEGIIILHSLKPIILNPRVEFLSGAYRLDFLL